jgi:hypothetical protein
MSKRIPYKKTLEGISMRKGLKKSKGDLMIGIGNIGGLKDDKELISKGLFP